MNSSQTPLKKTQTIPPESVAVAPSMEGCSGGPAIAVAQRAQTSKRDKSKRLIDSPLKVVGTRSRFAARILHSTTEDPAYLARFRTLVSAADFAGAESLCRERLLGANDKRTRVRWVNNFSIAKRVAGEYGAAFDLLISTRSLASHFGGTLRGDMEHGFARSLQTLRIFNSAFKHYEASHDFYEQAGDFIRAAGCDTNTGRCYTSAGQPENSHQYFERALKVARQSADSHLEGEIEESAALALEMEGKIEEAEACAHKSVVLISATGDRTALGESVATWQRLKSKLTEANR